MKTKLPKSIINIEGAKLFLAELISNNESFNPKTNPHEIKWDLPPEQVPTSLECDQLRKLMSDIYWLEGVSSIFDPAGFINDIKKGWGHIMEIVIFLNSTGNSVCIDSSGCYIIADLNNNDIIYTSSLSAIGGGGLLIIDVWTCINHLINKQNEEKFKRN